METLRILTRMQRAISIHDMLKGPLCGAMTAIKHSFSIRTLPNIWTLSTKTRVPMNAICAIKNIQNGIVWWAILSVLMGWRGGINVDFVRNHSMTNSNGRGITGPITESVHLNAIFVVHLLHGIAVCTYTSAVCMTRRGGLSVAYVQRDSFIRRTGTDTVFEFIRKFNLSVTVYWLVVFVVSCYSKKLKFAPRWATIFSAVHVHRSLSMSFL